MPPPSLPLLASTGGTKPPGKGNIPPSLVETLAPETTAAQIAGAEISDARDTLALVNEAHQDSQDLFTSETSLERYFDEHPDVVGAHDMVKTRRMNQNFLRNAYVGAAVGAAMAIGVLFYAGVSLYVGVPLVSLITLMPILIMRRLASIQAHPLPEEVNRFNVIEELIAQGRGPDDADFMMGDLSVDQLFQAASSSIAIILWRDPEVPTDGRKHKSIEAQRALHRLVADWGNWRAVFALNRLAEDGRLIAPGCSLSTVVESPRLIEYALSGDDRQVQAAELLASKSPAFETAYRKLLREKEGRDPSR